MQSSSNDHLKTRIAHSPRSPSATDREGNTSPRNAPVQLRSRNPNGHPELDVALQRGDFRPLYNFYTPFLEMLKPDTKKSAASAPQAALTQLVNTIMNSTDDAEESFERRWHHECHVHLNAAKANQVQLLARIDDMLGADLAAPGLALLREKCVCLGTTLTALMVKAKATLDAMERKEEARRRRNYSDSDSDLTPPPSPGKTRMSPEARVASPERVAQKRAQGEANSPVLAQSPMKRQKTVGALELSSTTATSTTTTSTASTPTTTSSTVTISTASTPTAISSTAPVVQASPAYRPVAPLRVPLTAVQPGSPVTGNASDTSANGALPAQSSPSRLRTLSPQARPRPRSQLFVAPPGSRHRMPDAPPSPSSVPKPPAPASAAPRTSAAEQALPDTPRSGEHS